MYNIKGPSKIVAKTTRRGISQNIDNFRDFNRNKACNHNNNIADDHGDINSPKPIFQKKSSFINPCRQESISPQHEEIIKFIHESWNSVFLDMKQNGESKDRTRTTESIFYFEDEPADTLMDFKPFDLESWWGKRLYAYCTSSSVTKN